MSFPWPETVRTRLVLTTTLVMALVLLALGFLVDLGTARTLLGSVDRELQRRGHDFAQGRARYPRRRDGPPPEGPPWGGPLRRPPRDAEQARPRFIESTPDPRGPHDEPYDPEAFLAAQASGAVYSNVTRDGEPFRVYSEAVRIEGRSRGVVQVEYPMADVLASLEGLRNLLLKVVVPLGALLAGLASLFLVNRMLRPLRTLTENAEHIGGNNLEERLPIVGADEFAGLATTLNGMLARLEKAFRLEQATTRRLEATVAQQRRFTADASHELKTPLATIKAHVGLLRMGVLAEEDRESVEAVDVAANRMNGLVGDLLALARADAGSLAARTAPVDLAHAVNAAIRAVAPLAVETRGAGPLVVHGDGEALARLFINLLDNAKKYADGPVEIRLAKRGAVAQVEVADRGAGIAPEHLPRLFDRFYRPDTSRTSETGGTGLGLAICKEIAAAHGGRIDVASEIGRGTTFTVILPLA